MSSGRLQQAIQAINQSKLLENLAAFDPTIVSTIWVGLDLLASDIDIVCCFSNANDFIATIESRYRGAQGFQLHSNNERILTRFYESGFQFEIYACTAPVTAQTAFRHFKVMEKLVVIGGENFQNQVRHLKSRGLKTEPAIAKLLQLGGEPFAAVLALEKCSDNELRRYLSRCN